MAHRIHRLSAVAVRNAKPGVHADGGGLYLQVTDTGARSWLFRYSVGGRERYCGLGSLNTVSLQDARAAAQSCRAMRLRGIDPIEARKAERAQAALSSVSGVSFKQMAEQYIAANESGWRSAKYGKAWRSTLARYVYPVLGALPVQSIATEHVKRVLDPIWSRKPETANHVRGRIEAVLDYAKAMGLRSEENPARWRGHMENLLPARSRIAKVVHHEALPYAEIGEFMAKLRKVEGVAARALELIVLTAARLSEVAGMRLGEIDWQGKRVDRPRGADERQHRTPGTAVAAGRCAAEGASPRH